MVNLSHATPVLVLLGAAFLVGCGPSDLRTGGGDGDSNQYFSSAAGSWVGSSGNGTGTGTGGGAGSGPASVAASTVAAVGATTGAGPSVGAGPTSVAASTTAVSTGATGGGGDRYQTCVDAINQYRATVGSPPLTRWNDGEACADQSAAADAASGQAHGSFPNCGEFAQNECPGWGVDEIPDCLQMMWDEGPGGGHYENMKSTDYTMVACGFSGASGEIWALQNFK